MTLNNINSKMDKKIRKRIKSRVKKERIINLWKFYSEIINHKLDINKITNYMNKINLIDENGGNLISINNINNINDLNNFIFNKLSEYLSSDNESESDSDSGNENTKESKSNRDESYIRNKKFNENNMILDNIISFKIKSSYYNLNSVTKGKIIKSENFKKNLKIIIKQYLKEKKEKNFYKSNIKSSKIVKNFDRNNYRFKIMLNNINTLSPKKAKQEMYYMDDISSISSNINEIKSKELNVNKIKNNKMALSVIKKNNERNKSIISGKIKKNINSTEIYKNFKNMEFNNRYYKKFLNDNNQKQKFTLSDIINKNQRSNKNKSKSLTSILFFNKKENKNKNNNNIRNTEEELLNSYNSNKKIKNTIKLSTI